MGASAVAGVKVKESVGQKAFSAASYPDIKIHLLDARYWIT